MKFKYIALSSCFLIFWYGSGQPLRGSNYQNDQTEGANPSEVSKLLSKLDQQNQPEVKARIIGKHSIGASHIELEIVFNGTSRRVSYDL